MVSTPFLCFFVGVQGFKGSVPPLATEVASLIKKVTLALQSHIRGIQGSIFVRGLHLGCVFTRKTSTSIGLIQNLEPNGQLFGKMSVFNEDFGSLSLRSFIFMIVLL